MNIIFLIFILIFFINLCLLKCPENCLICNSETKCIQCGNSYQKKKKIFIYKLIIITSSLLHDKILQKRYNA